MKTSCNMGFFMSILNANQNTIYNIKYAYEAKV